MTQKIGPYQLKEKLGHGGFATVWRAYDAELHRDVALKVLAPELARDPERVKRFRQEARMAAGLDHPNIVTIHEVKQYGNLHCICMAYVSGGSLRDYLEAHGRFTWHEAKTILEQVAAGLAYAHDRGVIHRDLKPSNVMLAEDGRAVLVDFGIARHVVEDNTRSLTTRDRIIGTPNYIPLEVWEEGKGDERADIYGLGCIGYEMLTGAQLFAGTPIKAMRAHDKGARFERPLPADVPTVIRPILEKATARNVEVRYQSVKAFRADLRNAKMSDISFVSQTSQPRATPERHDDGLKWLFFAAVVASLLLVSIGLVLLLFGDPADELSPPTSTEVVNDFQEEVPPTTGLPVNTLQGEEVALIEEPSPTTTEMLVPTVMLSPTATSQPILLPTITPTPKPEAGDLLEITLPTGEGVTMVFVPAGEFTMGSDAEEADADQGPEHQVFVADFGIDQTEVTNEQFATFVEAEGHHNAGSSAGPSLEPVTNVDWYDAQAFCEWREARLPTEAEWEKAARGIESFIYPWGNAYNDAYVNDHGDADGYGAVAPVGSFSPEGDSPYGAQDMAGNVWEWTSSIYEAYPYEDNDERNPASSNDGDSRVLRGGSWFDPNRFVRAPNRFKYRPSSHFGDVGFRCASHLP